MATTVVLDAGHGGANPGAVNGSRLEKDDALRFTLALGQILSRCGVNVVYTRSTDVDVPLDRRAQISNNANADLFVSIHRNASTNANAHGFENWVHTNANERAIAAAYLVHDRIVQQGVSADRGIRYADFVVLRLTRAPAILLELGFITNAGDNALFDSRFNQYVLAAAQGILNFFGISCPGVTAPGTTPPVTPPPNPPPPGNNTLRGTVTTTGGNLNLRNAPNTSAPVIGLIPNGSQVTILGESNGFYNVTFNGQTGWASSSFINAQPRQGTVSTAGGNLNIRSGPSTANSVIASVPNGTPLTVLDIIGNFYRVRLQNGQTGYASRDFIRLV